MSLLIRNARILTLGNGSRPRRGKELGDLGLIPAGEVLVADGKIAAVGAKVEAPADAEIIDALGRVVMPGFVDCHTHACWAGDRLDEWEMKLRGVPYLEILKKGGGIHATVKAVREATQKQLAASLRDRLGAMLREGTTTVEVKSGYGLNTENEMKMLRAIRRAAAEWPGTVVATALIGHAFEGDLDEYARMVVKDMLPEVSREFPDIAVDAYCEEGAWSVDACVKLFEKARKHHPIRVHADQFNSLGMIPEAIRLHARSVDHLEASTKKDLIALAQSPTCGVILPCTGLHTDQRFMRSRVFVDQGGALALATNCNPGTSPSLSIPLAIALAVRFCGLTPAEAIVAATVNAAAVLGFTDRGNIAAGQRADLLLLRHKDERALAYELGGNPVDMVICNGQVVR
ncbi:imidazolonepropionase [Opitutus sp. GAS368]|jgi:imidazolonepropionase|uniref:imidazolonepropionase n=1 Tax=Opitutus sp. GAS368 TaxID=1882749 RepID=UPI00087D6CD3|nr:imidazolonepropionase [Opitutus sp. GAS368]SDS50961.1 imidazolonepropionase [Opitutus sp. GAS368]